MTLVLQTAVLGLLAGGVYALMSSGFTLVFGVMRVLNLSHAALIIVAAFLSWWLWSVAGVDPLVAGFVFTPFMYALGWLIYSVVVARVQHVDSELVLVATFGVAVASEGVLALIWGTSSRTATPSYFNSSFHLGDIVVPRAQLYAAAGAVLMLGLLLALLRATFIGRAIRACAANPDGARLVGIDVDRTMGQMFAIGAATTGFGGGALAVLYQFIPDSQDAWIGRVLCVVILGGLGSILGAALGGAILGVGEAVTATYIDTRWSTAVPYVLIIAILVLRPQGLVGRRTRADLVRS